MNINVNAISNIAEKAKKASVVATKTHGVEESEYVIQATRNDIVGTTFVYEGNSQPKSHPFTAPLTDKSNKGRTMAVLKLATNFMKMEEQSRVDLKEPAKSMPCRFTLYDGAAIKGFTFIKHREEDVDAIMEAHGMIFDDYTEDDVAVLREFVTTAKHMMESVCQIFFASYGDMYFWRLNVPEELYENVQEGSIISFSGRNGVDILDAKGNAVMSAEGITLEPDWMTANQVLRVRRIDVDKFINGKRVLDEDGNPVKDNPKYFVYRPSTTGNKRLMQVRDADRKAHALLPKYNTVSVAETIDISAML